MPAVENPPPDRRDAAPPPLLLAALELQERVEALVAPLLTDLQASIPALRPWRRLASGAWVLGLHVPPAPRQGLRDTWSRVDLEIRIDSALRSVELTCRATARGHDLPARVLATGLDAPGEARLRLFTEAALLAFATAYWAMRHGPRRPELLEVGSS
jgi:hypothetical protein